MQFGFIDPPEIPRLKRNRKPINVEIADPEDLRHNLLRLSGWAKLANKAILDVYKAGDCDEVFESVFESQFPFGKVEYISAYKPASDPRKVELTCRVNPHQYDGNAELFVELTASEEEFEVYVCVAGTEMYLLSVEVFLDGDNVSSVILHDYSTDGLCIAGDFLANMCTRLNSDTGGLR